MKTAVALRRSTSPTRAETPTQNRGGSAAPTTTAEAETGDRKGTRMVEARIGAAGGAPRPPEVGPEAEKSPRCFGEQHRQLRIGRGVQGKEGYEAQLWSFEGTHGQEETGGEEEEQQGGRRERPRGR